MQSVNSLTQKHYPVIYEADQPTAVVVDIESFRQIEMILDNLLNRQGEPEDEVIAAASALWQRAIAQADENGDSADWITELNEL
jgi:hypothetical protein